MYHEIGLTHAYTCCIKQLCHISIGEARGIQVLLYAVWDTSMNGMCC